MQELFRGMRVWGISRMPFISFSSFTSKGKCPGQLAWSHAWRRPGRHEDGLRLEGVGRFHLAFSGCMLVPWGVVNPVLNVTGVTPFGASEACPNSLSKWCVSPRCRPRLVNSNALWGLDWLLGILSGG